MNNNSENNQKNENQFDERIDQIINEAVENAETRRELSDDEMDEVTGGTRFIPPIIIGLIKEDNTI
jgi:ClpP class serine protease